MDVRLYRPLNVSIDMSLIMAGRHMAYQHTLQQRSTDQYNHNLTVTWDATEENDGLVQLLGIYRQGTQHELSASLTAPDVSPIALEMSLVPSLENMQSSGRLTYGDDEYSMTSGWRYTYNNGINTAANLDITIPSRKITWEGDLRQNGGVMGSDMTLKWDAENDAEKALVTSLNIQAADWNPTLTTRVQWWPNNFVEFTTSLKDDERTIWSSSRDLEGTAQLTSSFPGYEQINGAFKHERTSTEVKTHGEYSWASERMISADVHFTKNRDWSTVDGSFVLNTPFEELEQLTVEQTYTRSPFSTMSKVQWNEMHVILETTASIESWSAITSEVKVTTTFPGYEDLTFAVHHSENEGHVESNVQTLFGSETFSVTLNMDHSVSGYTITNGGRLTAILPMLNSPNTLVWQHTHDRNSLTSHAELNIQGDRSILDLTGKLQPKIEMSTSLTTPYFPAVSASFSHEDQPYTTVFEATYDGQTVKLENEFNHRPNELVNLVTKLTTPFIGYEQITLTIDDKIEGGQYIAANEFKWGNNDQKISLGGTLTVNLDEYDIQAQLQFFSPYTNTVTLSMTNHLVSGMWQLAGDVIHGDQTLTRGTFTFGNGELKKFNIDFHSTCPYVSTLLFDFELTGNLRDFDNKIELEHNLLASKIQLSTGVRSSNINDLSATVGLITPFANMQSVDITWTHKNQPGVYETEMTIDHTSRTIKFLHRFDIITLTSFTTRTYVEPEAGSRYQLQTSLDFTENIAASARLQVPGEADRTISFTHEGELFNSRTTADVVYAPQKTIHSSVAFSYNDEGVSGEVTVTTPFLGWERSAITFEHHGPATAFNNNGAIELMGERVTAQSEFSLQGNNMNLRASGTTPLEEMRTASIVISHTMDTNGFETSVNVHVNDETFTSSVEFRDGDRKTGQFNMVAPWFFDSLNANFEHSGSLTDFNNNARIHYNGENLMSGVSRFRMVDSETSGSASLTTPFAGFESTSVTFEHHGPLSSFNNNGAIQRNGQTVVSVETQFRMTESEIAGSASLTTPFAGFESTSISFDHHGSLSNFNNNGAIELMGQRVTGHTEFSLDGYNMRIQANMVTPFETMQTMTMTITHDGEINNFETSVRVEVNNEVFTSNAAFQNGDRITGRFGMVAPWFFDSLNVNFEHSGSITDFNNNANIEYNGHRTSSVNEFSLSGTNMHALFKILIPSEISIELNHNGGWMEFANSATMKYFEHTYSGNSNFRLQGTDSEANIEVHTPFQGFTNMGAHYTHTGDLANFNCNFNMNLEGARITGQNQMRVTDNQFVQSVTIEAPFEGLTRLGYTVTHVGPINNFNNEISAFIESDTISTTTVFKLLDNLFEFSTSINTPWEMLRTFSTALKHDHEPNNCRNEMRVTLNEHTTSGIATFTTQGAIKRVNVEFNIPGHSMRTIGTHQGTLQNFQNQVTITLDDDTYQSDVRFSISGNTVEGSATLNTPFTELSNFALTFSHEGDVMNFNNEITASLNGDSMSANTEFSVVSDRVHGLFRITTPSGPYEFTLNHRGGLYDFQNTISANINGVTVSTNTALQWTSVRLHWSMNIQAPECNFEITNTNQGTWSDFTNQFTVSFNEDVFSINHAFRKQNTVIEGSLNVARTDDFAASFSYRHTGIISNFQDELSFTLDEQTSTIRTSFRFTDAIIEGSVNIATPFTDLETASLAFKYEGPWYNCKNELSLSVNQNTISTNAEFEWTSSVEGLWRIQWMDSEVLALEFRHEGPWSDFTNEVSVTVYQQRVSMNNAFEISGNRLSMALALRTPFTIGEIVTFNMAHQGGVFDFSNEMTFVFDQQTVRMNCQFHAQGSEISGTWALTTPAGTITVTGSHSGEWYSCNSRLSVSVNDNTMEASSHFRKTDSQIEGSLSINQLNLAFSHDNNDGVFNNDFTVNFDGEEGRVSTTVQMDESGVRGNARVNTPFNGYRTMAVSASTQDENFILKLQRELDEFSLTTSHSSTPNGGRVSFTITTPFESAREIIGTFSHDGPINDFQQVASLEVNGQKIEHTLIFAKTADRAEGSYEITTPFSQLSNFKISVTHNSLFNNNGYIMYNGERYSGSTEFRSTDEGIHGYIGIQTPAEYSITFDHSGTSTDFVNQVTVKYGPTTLSKETRFRMSGSTIEGILTVNTPETVRITFNHDGEMTDFRQSVQVEYSGKTISQSAEFSLSGRRVNAKFSLASPCPYVQTLNIELQHQGRWTSFGNTLKLELNGQAIELGSEYKELSAKTIGSISLKTPLEYSLNFVFKGEPSDLTTMIRCTIAGQKSNVNVAYRNTGSVIETSLSVRTPYEGYENFASEFHFKNKRVLRISGSITTPFESFDNMAFEFSKEGTWRQFTLNGRLTTPFTIMPEGTFAFTHRGTVTNFECSGTLDLGDRHFAGSTMFQYASNRIQASATLESPYFSSLGYTFKHEGGIRNFNTEASVEMNGDRIESTLAFKSRPAIEVTATIRTPFNIVRELSFSSNHQGGLMDFSSTASISLNGQAISGTMAFRKDGEVIESNAELHIPNWRPISYNVAHNGNINRFHTVISITIPCEEHQNFGLELNHEGTLANFHSSAILTTPFSSAPRIASNLAYSGQPSDFTSSASVEFGSHNMAMESTFRKSSGWTNSDMEASIRLTSSFPALNDLHISTEQHWTTSSLTGQAEATYNGNKKLDMDYNLVFGSSRSVNINVRAPISLAISAHIQEESSSTSGEFSVTYNNEPYRATFVSNNNGEVTVAVSWEGRTITMTSRYSLTSDRFTYFTEFRWSDDPNDKFSYDIELSRGTRGQQNFYDGRLTLGAKQYTFTTTFSHRLTPGRQYVTEVNIQGLVFRTDVQLRQPNLREFTTTITVQHASFTRVRGQDLLST